MTIKLLVPDMPSADELLPYLRQIDANRHYTNYGPLNTMLEAQLAARLICHSDTTESLHITTVANATLGLEVVFQALCLPKAAKVLMPSLTFPATATAVVRQGLTPVFSDIDASSWLLTPEIARAALAVHPDIKLIVPVAAFGVPVAVAEWDQFVEDTGIPVVVDAAGAFGNQRIGKHIHIVFSLHATKALGGGEGGFIATYSHDLISRIRILSNFGINPEQDAKIFMAGTNAKMSEYHAAVTLASLDRWESRQILRMNLLSEWLTKLTPLMEEGAIEIQLEMEKHSHSLLPLRFTGIHDLSSLIDNLSANHIQTRRWYYPLLPSHPAFSTYATLGDISFAQQLSSELLGLPFHLDLTSDDIDYIIRALTKYLRVSNAIRAEMVA
jgi:dTDP-4-amino-4,6-dideoxygalactose transaminase